MTFSASDSESRDRQGVSSGPPGPASQRQSRKPPPRPFRWHWARKFKKPSDSYSEISQFSARLSELQVPRYPSLPLPAGPPAGRSQCLSLARRAAARPGRPSWVCAAVASGPGRQGLDRISLILLSLRPSGSESSVTAPAPGHGPGRRNQRLFA